MQSRDAQRRKQKGKRVEGERQRVAESRDRGPAEKRSDHQRAPLRQLGQRIRRVQFIFVGDRWENRRAAAGEERRSEHQAAAEQIQQPGVSLRDAEDEQQSDPCANQVAGDHQPFAVHPIEQHAGNRPAQHHRSAARQQDSRDHQARSGIGQYQAEHGDVVIVIADLADHLPHPRVAVIPIGAQQLREAAHVSVSSRTVTWRR